ncbi:cytochrome P450 [Pseudovirgaria hyperparasitica]|uniref:Cytochrome P450 n=1 Tax=Pseudovirgaria hyperparasitica TaxID=470096 RepID=A0A6A6WFB7_9PEZI|nr:cytochrome P450 [Pseudovirgaria hyperparasitica]KAF2760576.1 cytochrome P450 [Pseudovirgaria hyperparasitica]
MSAQVLATVSDLIVSHPYLTALLALLTYIIVQHTRSYLSLSHIPGPPLAHHTTLPLIRACLSGHTASYLSTITAQYGPLARIGPDHLLTSDPATIQRMSGARSPYRKSYWYGAMKFKPRSENLLSERDEARHEALRRKMAGAYSGREVGVEGVVDERVEEMVSLIEKKYAISKETSGPSAERNYLNVALITQYFTVDVISHLAYGVPWGDVASETDKYGYIEASETNMPTITAMALLPRLLAFFEKSYILDWLSPATQESVGLGMIVNATGPIIRARLAMGKEHQEKDMLGAFIRSGLGREELESESTLQVLAGSDTTATTIRVGLLYICSNASVLRKLRAEFDSAEISSPITDAEARKLPYLQAVIKESIRIVPPVTGMFSKEVPPEGDIICGKKVPGGTLISQCSLAIQRHEVFGTDPESFIPERWIGISPEQHHEMSQTVDLVFGYGKYQCLGRPVALLELNKVFVELLRRFDFTVRDPQNPWDANNAGLWSHRNFLVSVSQRQDVQ